MKRIALSSLAATVAAATLAVSLAGPAQAYQCKGRLTQTEAIHKVRLKSHAAARSFWSAKVKQAYGLPWSMWKIASAKSVSCRHTGAAWYCIARARPCLYVVP